MSVDFQDCDKCGESICLCGEHASCETCGVILCFQCANKMNLGSALCSSTELENGDFEEYENYEICPYCSGDEATDTVLLDFALEKLKMSKESLIISLKEKKGLENVIDKKEG